MSAFQRLPGFTRSPPGLEQRIWRHLPAVLLWGTLLPLGLAALRHLLAHDAPAADLSGTADGDLLRWDFALLGFVLLHWTLVLTVALGCIIVRVMKGPAYVADAYELPQPDAGPGRDTRTPLASPQGGPAPPR